MRLIFFDWTRLFNVFIVCEFLASFRLSFMSWWWLFVCVLLMDCKVLWRNLMVLFVFVSMVLVWCFFFVSWWIFSSSRNGDVVGVGAGFCWGVFVNLIVVVLINLFGVFIGGVCVMKFFFFVVMLRVKSTAFRLSSSKRRENSSRLRLWCDIKFVMMNVLVSIVFMVMICKMNKIVFVVICSEFGNTYS